MLAILAQLELAYASAPQARVAVKLDASGESLDVVEWDDSVVALTIETTILEAPIIAADPVIAVAPPVSLVVLPAIDAPQVSKVVALETPPVKSFPSDGYFAERIDIIA